MLIQKLLRCDMPMHCKKQLQAKRAGRGDATVTQARYSVTGSLCPVIFLHLLVCFQMTLILTAQKPENLARILG